MTEPTYLGDVVYARFDGYHVWLWTDHGFGPECQIAIEPDVWDRLVRYRAKCVAPREQPDLFDSLEDADAHDYPVGAEIGVRGNPVLIYKLMDAGNGDRFWRLTNE